MRRYSRRQTLRAGAGAAGVVSLAVAGCAAPAAAPTAPQAATSAPAATSGAGAAPGATAAPARAPAKYGGKVISMGSTRERVLDPHMANGLNTSGANGPAVCYSQLMTLKWGPDVKAPSYLVTNDLAESWTQPDETTYLFKLRPGVKWHNVAPVNGRELVAEDIVFSFQRLRDLRAHAAVVAGIARMEAPDRSTVRLTLEKPNADFLPTIADYRAKIVAREQVESQGDLTGPPVIGTGPWVFEKWEPDGSYASVRRNPDYYVKGQPYLDQIESFRVTDSAQLVNALRSKVVTLVGVTLSIEQVADLTRSVPNLQQQWIILDASGDELGMRVTEEPFTDVRIRQAINKAIDRKAIIDSLFAGRAVLSAGIVVPQLDWALPEAELQRARTRDLEGARALMRQAGKEAGIDVECLVPNYRGGAYVTEAELIQANLREIGVRLTLKTLDAVTYVEQLTRGAFKMYIGNNGSLGITNLNLYNVHYTGGGMNRTGYSSPQLDRLIDQQAGMAKDPEGRKRILLEIQRHFVEQAYAINIVNAQQSLLYYPEIKDIYPPISFNLSTDFWNTTWMDK